MCLEIFFNVQDWKNIKWMVQLFLIPFIEVTPLGITQCLVSLATAPVGFIGIPCCYWDQATLAVEVKWKVEKLFYFYLTFQRKDKDIFEVSK